MATATPPIQLGDFGTTGQLARECGLSQATIYLHIRSGKLPAQRVGDRLLIARSDMDEFKHRRAAAAAAKARGAA